MEPEIAEDIDVLVEWALVLTGTVLVVAGAWAFNGWRAWAVTTGFVMAGIAAYRIGRLAERRIERARRHGGCGSGSGSDD